MFHSNFSTLGKNLIVSSKKSYLVLTNFEHSTTCGNLVRVFEKVDLNTTNNEAQKALMMLKEGNI